MSSRVGTYHELVEDRRAVIVRSKVKRPLCWDTAGLTTGEH